MQDEIVKLTDAGWQIISVLLPVQRKREIDLRSVVESLFYMARTGCQWRALPEKYPKWTAVSYYYYRWIRLGIFEDLNMMLNMIDRASEGKEPFPSLLCVDSQSIKLGPFIDLDRGIDGNKKVNGRKRQAAVDTGGRVWVCGAHAANISDSEGGSILIGGIEKMNDRLKKVLTDGAYPGAFTVALTAAGIEHEVASRPPTERGFVPIKWRWVSERTFGCFNFFRRLSKDYETTVRSSSTWVLIVNTIMMLNRIQC